MFESSHALNRKLSTAAAVAALCAVPVSAQNIIVNDSFADGDRMKTGALDTNWWTSTSGSGIEDNADDGIGAGILGLVTGGSGRGIHTIFPQQTLANDTDKLTASWTFTTPATVGTNKGTSFRVGLFDSLGRAGLDADVSASSSNPNALYGDLLDPITTPGLPGFMHDLDVNTDATADISFRDSTTAAPSGRAMATTGAFFQLGSGPDEGYTFAPNTEYSGSFSVERNAAGDLVLSATFTQGGTTIMHSLSELAGDVDSYNFDMLAFHVNSSTFGSSNSPGAADNGIDFSNITIETNFGGTPLVPGDADGDGDVDDTDLGIAISNFTGPGGTGKTLADGDTDGDGDVDDTDLGVAISGFTGPLSPAAVPEPTSLALLTLGGLLAARRRRA